MTKRKIFSCIIFAALYIVLLIAGCSSMPVPAACSHQSLILHGAVPADFFHAGNIAYYQCAECGIQMNAEKEAVDTIVIPKLSPNVSVCINGTLFPLSPVELGTERLTWSLEGIKVATGDVLTVQDTFGGLLACTFTGDGSADGTGTIAGTASSVNLLLTVTPTGAELSVTDGEYQGIVVQVNDTQYPMHQVSAPDADLYVYGYLELKSGDRLAIHDNVADIAYGHAALAQDQAWNLYDYHCGEAGECIIDAEGRYRVEFSRSGDEKIRIVKVFTPIVERGYAVRFRDTASESVLMQETDLSRHPYFSEKYTWFDTGEIAVNGADIAAHLNENDLLVYSSLLYLEEGTQFCIEGTAGTHRITGDHMTQTAGSAGCAELSGEYVRISQSGTYLIKYLPFCDSFALEQLSTQGIYQTAKEFDKRIAAVPTNLEHYYAQEILSLYEAYLYLGHQMRPYLKALPKLQDLYRKALAVEASADPIIYYIGTPDSPQVYRSREALCTAFYTDFYYYIAAYHGTEYLEEQKITCVKDFLDLATGVTNADYSKTLYGIGYIAGRYFLASSSNGIPENQPETTFLGFCHKNGLYRELIPFLIRFFAYWRIDEHYAIPENNGADFFAEAWAPTVDVAKFFYYDENTSYVQTERMLDCFRNTACVVYGFDQASALPTLKLRGYIFEGWYDNPTFLGEPITQANLPEGQLKLYAKWRPDTARQDRDRAALVDVYIYNLTTQRAWKTAETVGYVKAMYDSLSQNAKQLVEEYSILKNLIALYCK